MNWEELWIGDYLLVRSLEKVGRYDGVDGASIKVRIGEKVLLFEKDDCILIEDPLPSEVHSSNDSDHPKSDPFIEATIDLHLEKLEGGNSVKHGEELSFQRKACQDFLNKAIRGKAKRVVIIHGHGDGILRQAIHDLLGSYQEVERFDDWLSGASTEVWLNND